MRGYVIKIYYHKNDFYGYKSYDVVNKDIRKAIIYLTKEMAERVAEKNIGLPTEIVPIEINEVAEGQYGYG